MLIQKLKPYKVYLTYFFSYMVILSLSLTALLLVIQFDLKAKFNDVYRADLQHRVDYVVSAMEQNFLALHHSADSIRESQPILQDSCSTESYYTYLMQNEFKKHLNSSSVLQDVIAIDTRTQQVYGAYYHYELSNNDLLLRYNSDTLIPFSLDEFDFKTGALLYSSPDAEKNFLFFVPEQATASFRVIFLLKQSEWDNMLLPALTDQTRSVDLYRADGTLLFTPLSFSSTDPSSDFVLSAHSSYPDFTLRFYYNDTIFAALMMRTFQSTYLIVFVLAVLGMGVIILLTNYMYAPRKLLASFMSLHMPNSSGEPSDYLEFDSIQQAFEAIQKENETLLSTINGYQANIHHSLLENCVKHSTPEKLQQVQTLFAQGSCKISVAECHSKNGLPADLADYIQNSFDLKMYAVPLSMEASKHVLLLVFPLTRQTSSLTEDFLHQKTQTITQHIPCSFHFSQLSDNPLDIFRLQEQVMLLSRSDRHTSIFALVDDFEDALADNDYPLAGELLDSIFSELDHSSSKYFVQSILLTVLNVLVQNFTFKNISLSYFSNEYNEALYWSRTVDYPKYRVSIQDTYHTLLSLLVEQPHFEKLTRQSCDEYINSEFCNSSFSINQLGEHFQVSGSYISYWFKKNYGENLSDYLWNLRFKKAVQLMRDPAIGMNDISSQVGYDNYSSFRRKFKTACGLSPSEYRKKYFGL